MSLSRSKSFGRTLAATGLAIFTAGCVAMSACGTAGKRAAAARLATIQASPQWRDGRFRNTLPRRDGSFLTMAGRWIVGSANTRPESPLLVVERRAGDFSVPPASGLRLTWLGHSTVLVEIDGHRVLLDPVLGERASPFTWVGPKRFHEPPLALDELPPLDAVVISHDHYDHLDEATLRALGDKVPRFVVPLGVGAHLEAWGVAPERILERDWWGEAEVEGLRLVATPARHFSGRSLVMAGQDQTLWAGWAILGPAHRVYYSGDTAMFPGFAEIGERLGPFDAALLETGAYNALWPDVHMGPEQAVVAHGMVRGGLYVPVHWGTFDLALHAWTEPVERLLAAAERASVRVAVPRPGELVEPADPPALTRWWPEVPWQAASAGIVVSTGLDPALEQRIRAVGASGTTGLVESAPGLVPTGAASSR